jgi:hypothetical protein
MEEIVVKSRDTVGEYIKGLNKDFILISVTNPGWKFVEVPESEHCRGVLQLRFQDTSRKRPDKLYFKRKQALLIKRFVEKNNVPIVISQCDHGISRSAGVAAALARVNGLDVEWFFSQAGLIPNMFVFDRLLGVYHVKISDDEKKWLWKLFIHRMKRHAGLED